MKMNSTTERSTREVFQSDLTGNAHNRFVIVTTLLSLIDPVRGEPTTHSLDRHPHDDSWKPEQLQKKFLDSFALIASTSRKGAETASAVCLEQGGPEGAVLRLASNRGVTKDTVDRLQEILNILALVASREKTAQNARPELLLKITILAEDKIRSILEQLDNPDIHNQIQDTMMSLIDNLTISEDQHREGFSQWIRDLPAIVSLNRDYSPSTLIPRLEWASKARWVYVEPLEELFGSNDGQLPVWLKYIYKLGRYYVAAQAMLKLANKQPGILEDIHVKVVQSPPQVKFSLQDKVSPLSTVLAKISPRDTDTIRKRLGQIWFTDDPETRLRHACKMRMTVHAEMQLLSFYDHHLHLTPRLLFMGTSKKACYLCYEFMSRHPLAIGVSACHQKLYKGWLPAPCSSDVRKKHKVLLWEFTRSLEQTTARDLETRLGTRRPYNSDSTAGPSLTSTGSWFTGTPETQD